MKTHFLVRVAAVLMLTACAGQPTLNKSSTLTDLANKLAIQNNAGKRFETSATHPGLILKNEWRIGSEKAIIEFTNWCELHPGSHTVAVDNPKKVEDELSLVLNAQGISGDVGFITRYCTVGNDTIIMAFDKPNTGWGMYVNRHGASLVFMTMAELEKYAPPLVAERATRQRKAADDSRLADAQRARNQAAYEERYQRDKKMTADTLASYKSGTRILCISDISERTQVIQGYKCNGLPDDVNTERLILSGWDVVSKEQSSSSIRIILSKR